MSRVFVGLLVVFLICTGLIHARNMLRHRLIIEEEAMTHVEELLTPYVIYPDIYRIGKKVTTVKYADSSQIVLDTWLTLYSHKCNWADISKLQPYISFAEYSSSEVKVLIRTRWVVNEDRSVLEGAIEIKEDGEEFHLHRTHYKHKH